MTIQNSIDLAKEKLQKLNDDNKASRDSVKQLKKQLKQRLKNDSKYQELVESEKRLKQALKDLKESLDELKKEKEQIEIETEEYKELEDFLQEQEQVFEGQKNVILLRLGQDLSEQGILSEVLFKKNELSLIVART